MGRLTRIRYRDRRDNGQITGSPTCRAIVRRNAAVSAWPLPDSISSELTADRFRIDDLTFPAFFMEDPGRGARLQAAARGLGRVEEHASVWTIARRKEFFVGDVLSFLHAGMMKFEILLSPPP